MYQHYRKHIHIRLRNVQYVAENCIECPEAGSGHHEDYYMIFR